MAKTKDLGEGWAKPLNSRKFHYFDDTEAICGAWLYAGPREKTDNANVMLDKDCKACHRKLKKRGKNV